MKKNKKLIPFIIIALFVFQVISASIDCFDNNKNSLHQNKMLLSVEVYHNEILNIGRENQKSPIMKAQSKDTAFHIPGILHETDLDIDYFYGKAIDSRKIIRQSIQNYFNGSKYKYNHLVIQ